MSIHTSKLANGLTVVINQMPFTGRSAVGVFVKAGARHEPDNLAGISHFLEHMAFKGTTTRSYRQIAVEAEKLGASMNAFTSDGVTAYHISGLAEHAPVFIDVLSDILKNSTFPEDELTKERDVIKQEIKMYDDDPSSVTYEGFTSVAYSGQSVGRPIIGSAETVDSITRDDLITYFKKMYTASNMVVSVAGNVDVEATLSLISEKFGSIEEGTLNQDNAHEFSAGISSNQREVEQAVAQLGFDYFPTSVEGRVLASIAVAAMGNGMSSPVFDQIREQLALAYSASTFNNFSRGYGFSAFWIGTDPEKVELAFTKFIDMMLSSDQFVTADDLERAKNKTLAGFVAKKESPHSEMMSGSDIIDHGRILRPEDYIAIIDPITLEQVHQVLKEMVSRKIVVSVTSNKPEVFDIEFFGRIVSKATIS